MLYYRNLLIRTNKEFMKIDEALGNGDFRVWNKSLLHHSMNVHNRSYNFLVNQTLHIEM